MAKEGLEFVNYTKFNEAALKELNFVKHMLMVEFEYFNPAIFRLSFKASPSGYACDGEYFYYNPAQVVSAFIKKKPQYVARDFLHSLLHCSLKHMASCDPLKNNELWNLACDIAVECIINETKKETVDAEDGLSASVDGSSRRVLQKEHIARMESQGITGFAAEIVYRHLLSFPPTAGTLKEMKTAFYADSHDSWYADEITVLIDENQNSGSGADNSKKGDSKNNDIKSQSNMPDAGSSMEITLPGGKKMVLTGVSSSTVKKSVMASDEVLEKKWDDTARDMQNLAQKAIGNVPGTLTLSLGRITKEHYDYTEFLKRFAVKTEVTKINEDEFDTIYYTYGMNMNPNVRTPFIEPLEYKEDHRIRDFAIAVDTSGSVDNKELRAFLRKTYSILKQTESFDSAVNIQIIQCDTRIQDICVINDLSQLDGYISNLTIKGRGGTSFNPVFDHVQQQIDEGVFKNLKGIIYFTDGLAHYPPKPDFDVTFVFVSDQPDPVPPDFPSWADKIVFTREEFSEAISDDEE